MKTTNVQSAAHTPGPWTITEYVGDAWLTIIHETGDLWDNIAKIADRGAESKANARLIAAAPDLLAATKKALDAIGHQATLPGGAADRVIADALRAAIAKAEAA